jgi:hypothetical protein
MTNRWLLLNFDALGSLAVLVTTLFTLSGYVRAGLAAVCVRVCQIERRVLVIFKFLSSDADYFRDDIHHFRLLGMSVLD